MSGWTQSSVPGIAAAVREAAQGSDWKVREGALSSVRGGDTFHASIFADAMNFYAKPLKWDEIYWTVMGTEFKRPPQPTRHWTSMSRYVPIRAQARVRARDAAALAAALLRFADAERERARDVDRLPEVRFAPNRDADFQMARVVEMLAGGDRDGAVRLARDVADGRVRSMYTHNTQEGSFFELFLRKFEAGAFGVTG